MTFFFQFNTNAYRLVCSAMALVLLGICVIPSAQAEEKRSFNIPPQSLGLALIAYSKQADKLVVAPQDLVTGKTAPAIAGDMPAHEALTRLLAGSGLRYVQSEDGAIRILADGTASHGARNAPEDAPDALRLVKAEAPQNSSSETSSTAASDVQDPGSEKRSGKGVPEILVKGKRSSNADIERSEDDVQPYVVFNAQQIERSMASSVEEFLKTRLPMNAASRTNGQNTNGAFFGNQSSIDLRGLGTNQTLILVNGRRQPAVSNIASFEANFNQPDINGLPMSAIERIEILPSTASGIYGGGATGGAINIVLKRDYSGFDVSASYDNVFNGDAAQRRIEGNAGFSLEGGKTSVMVSGSYSDANRLLSDERDFARRGLNLTRMNDRASLFSRSTPLAGYTTNIRSANGQNLVLDNGIPLGSRFTYVPVGYAGRDSDDGMAFIANANEYNYDPPQDLYGARQSLLSNPTKSSLALNVRREFGARLELFADLAMRSNQGRSATAPLANFVNALPADAPNNPFQQPINVSFPNVGLTEFQAVSDSDFQQAAGGFIVRLPHRWTAQAEYGWHRTRYEYTSTNPAFDTAARTALGNGTLDVLRDLNMYPLDFSPYLVPSPNLFRGPFDTTLKTATARLAGPALDLPGGPLALTVLLEHREEVAAGGFEQLFNPTTRELNDPYFYPSRDQRVDSAYLEILAPLISAGSETRFAHELELQASVRHDKYETTSVPQGGVQVPSRDGPFPEFERGTNNVKSTDYTLGLRYLPTPNVTLRVSYGTGFLAPSVAQIVPLDDPFGFLQLADPKREDVFRFYFPLPVRTGGNPDLTPEESASWSAGVVFTPVFLRGLRLSLDYTRIEKSNEIYNLLDQEIIDNEEIFSSRVIRADLTPEDEALGYTAGEIIGFDNTADNIASTELEAFDIQLDYGWETAFGTFNFYALATYQPHFKRQILPSSPIVDSVGFSGGPLEWRGNAGITLDRGAWSFGWNMQYYDTYIVYSADSVDSTINALKARQGSKYIPSQNYHDVFARYRFDHSPAFAAGLLADVEVMLGIQNVLSTSPPIVATPVPSGGYSTFGDPRLRRYSLSLNKHF